MRISELAAAAGIPIATVKYYIREGMLPRGAASGATRADYDDEHLARLRLIAALTGVRALPIARVRDVLALIDEPPEDPVATMGAAVGALPPYVAERAEFPRARAAIEALGFTFDERFAAVGQLEAAIEAVEAAGLPWDDATVRRYGEAMRHVASEELRPMAGMTPREALAYAVLGTALHEPVMLALRRLAHQHLLVSGEAAARPGETVPQSGEAD